MIDKRVIVRPCQRVNGFNSTESKWMGSCFNGAFAQYVKVTATGVFVVNSETWTDVDLGSLPCAYGSSENMIIRA